LLKDGADSKTVKPAVKTTNTGDFSINETTDSYTLNNVFLGGVMHSFAWTKELLDGGNSHIQDDWVKITDQLPDTRAYYASLLELYKNKDGPQSDLVEKVRKMFAKDFKDNWMMTGTRVTYKPKGKDKVTHNYDSASETSIDTTFVGSDGYVNSKSSFEDEMEVLFGTKDCKEVSEVFKWVTKKATYLWRLNSKPSKGTEERAVVLGVNYGNDGFYINAYVSINYDRPARGVVVAREKVP
jgi:hypothetical protein